MPRIESDDDIRTILRTARRIAVVGLSDKPWRDSYSVSWFMHHLGYDIIPINPNIREVFGIRALTALTDIGGPVDIVNVFRRAEFVPALVEEAIRIQARTVWLQTGIVHEEASRRAEEAGLNVVSDRCIRVAYLLLMR